jgi:hypothetical protein
VPGSAVETSNLRVMSSNLSEGASDIIEHTNATHRGAVAGAGAKGVHAKEPEESNCKTKRKRSKKLNAVEIEEAISALAEQPFDAHEFAFAFLQAFGLAAIAVAVNWQMRIVDPVKGIDFDKVGLRRWLVDHEIASPERGPDTAGCHHFSSRLRMYGFHFIGVTVCSVPLLESIQPAAVRRHGYGSRYHLPRRPSLTNSVTSSSTGAVSRERQSYLSACTIMSKSGAPPSFVRL